MAAVTIHVVQAFEQRDDGVIAAEPKSCPSAGSARALADVGVMVPRGGIEPPTP